MQRVALLNATTSLIRRDLRVHAEGMRAIHHARRKVRRNDPRRCSAIFYLLSPCRKGIWPFLRYLRNLLTELCFHRRSIALWD